MDILSSAPTRIDLAGGTLDLWPLHLFFRNPPTLNAAIDLYATVRVKTRPGRSIRVESRDRGLRASFTSLAALPEQHPLQLILRLVRFYRPRGGLEVVTDCQAPAGSGIGGSSALNIALNGALNRLTGNRYPRRTLVEIAKNIETQVINVPAGVQDYFSALYGGVQSIRPDYNGVRRAALPVDPKALTSRFVLCYTGEPRASGINNWQVYKDVIDGSPVVRRCLGRIAAAACQMEKKLANGTLNRFAEDFEAEWQARRRLAPGISTPAMERLIAAARRAGAMAAKVCGAGGGGCVAFFVPAQKHRQVAAALTAKGGRVLPCRFVKRGLVVKTRALS